MGAWGGGGVSALGSAHSLAGPDLSNLLQLRRSAWLQAGAGQETLDQVRFCPKLLFDFVIHVIHVIHVDEVSRRLS